MTELKWICISSSLTLLLSLAVGSPNMDQKWRVENQFGYQGGFCLPGLCIGGSGGSRVHYGRDHYGGGGGRDMSGFRETMYCKPLTCWGGSCDALHLHLDKGLYESLMSKNAIKHPSTIDYTPETCASGFSPVKVRLKRRRKYRHRKCKTCHYLLNSIADDDL